MTLRDTVRQIVDGTDTFAGRAFDWSLLALILWSIATFTVETIPDLENATVRFLWYSEVVITALFTVEYAVRIWIAERTWRYVFSFNGLIDLVAVAPFYITLMMGLGAMDLRAARAFRLFRVLQLLKIRRYDRAVARFRRAWVIAREEMVLYLLLTVIMLFLSATGIYYFESAAQPEVFKSIPHSLWWALATLTTVGYGDVYPITVGGRIFTFFVLMVGLGIVAGPAGLIASALAQARREEADRG